MRTFSSTWWPLEWRTRVIIIVVYIAIFRSAQLDMAPAIVVGVVIQLMDVDPARSGIRRLRRRITAQSATLSATGQMRTSTAPTTPNIPDEDITSQTAQADVTTPANRN